MYRIEIENAELLGRRDNRRAAVSKPSVSDVQSTSVNLFTQLCLQARLHEPLQPGPLKPSSALFLRPEWAFKRAPEGIVQIAGRRAFPVGSA